MNSKQILDEIAKYAAIVNRHKAEEQKKKIESFRSKKSKNLSLVLSKQKNARPKATRAFPSILPREMFMRKLKNQCTFFMRYGNATD